MAGCMNQYSTPQLRILPYFISSGFRLKIERRGDMGRGTGLIKLISWIVIRKGDARKELSLYLLVAVLRHSHILNWCEDFSPSSVKQTTLNM